MEEARVKANEANPVLWVLYGFRTAIYSRYMMATFWLARVRCTLVISVHLFMVYNKNLLLTLLLVMMINDSISGTLCTMYYKYPAVYIHTLPPCGV